MSYRTVKESFWTDPKIRQLSPDEKLLFLYFVTNPHSHYSGLYYLPITFMIEETGMSQKTLSQCLANLESRLLIRYDKVTSTMFVVKMFRHQKSTGGNPRVIWSGIEKQLQNIHSQVMINSFLTEYQILISTLPKGWFNVESTLCQGTVPDTDTDTDTVPDSVKEGVQEDKQKDQTRPLSPKDPKYIFLLPAWIDPAIWEKYLEMRKSKKNVPTEYAKYLVMVELEKLKKQGQDVTAVLNQSIRRKWIDVYAVKVVDQNGQPCDAAGRELKYV